MLLSIYENAFVFNNNLGLASAMSMMLLILGLVATLLPFVYITLSSLKPGAELRRTPPAFFPQSPTLEHYTTS